MIDAHPQVAVPDESHFLPMLASRRHALEAGSRLDEQRLFSLLQTSPGFRRWQLDQQVVRERFAEDRPKDLAAAVRLLYATYAQQHGKDRYADKTTTYVFAMHAIAGLLPDARFVHLIRDGRNVALSLLAVPWGPSSVEQAAVWWRTRVEAARSAGRQLGAHRYIEVRFEALAADPERQLRRLAGFVGIPWHDQMLEYHQRAATTILATMPARRQGTHDNLRRPPSLNLRDWRREMSTTSQFVFEALAGDLLDELGYERCFPSVAPLVCPTERRTLIDRPRRRRSA